MGWVQIGARLTFLPPFVNERFGSPPYWACTFTAGLLGANIAKLGRIPATHAEVIALAKESGDDDLKSGSRSSHLATALKARYGLTIRRQNVSEAEAKRRLANGWALVAGCWYGKLPVHFRRWSPKFVGGHRVTLTGWSGTRTRLFDPMADAGPTYQGEWIEWADFAAAWWSDEQCWILEGELMQQTLTILAQFDPPRPFRIPAGATIQAWRLTGPGTKAPFANGSAASFNAVVAIDQAPDPTLTPHGAPFVRVADGVFKGQFIPASVLRNPDGSALDLTPPQIGAADLKALELAARQAEYDRVTREASVTPPLVTVTPKITWPVRPSQ